MAASKKKAGKKAAPAKASAKKPATTARGKTVKKASASAKSGATSRPQSSKGKPRATKASGAAKPAAKASAPNRKAGPAAASQPERASQPIVLAGGGGGGGRQALGGASLGGNAFAGQTAGKWTMKPPTKPEGFGKAVAQMTSNTRMANEAPYALGRSNTDFARLASTTLAAHRAATDRRMQSKRDSKAAGSGD